VEVVGVRGVNGSLIGSDWPRDGVWGKATEFLDWSKDLIGDAGTANPCEVAKFLVGDFDGDRLLDEGNSRLEERFDALGETEANI
jgi:hypothetical protein